MNWNERIDAMEKRGHSNKKECRMAANWPTCACGEQDSRIQRDERGCPLDERLRELGSYFTTAIYRDEFAIARENLLKIEARAAEVLAEVEAGK